MIALFLLSLNHEGLQFEGRHVNDHTVHALLPQKAPSSSLKQCNVSYT